MKKLLFCLWLALGLATAALAQPGPTPLLKALQAGDTTQARQLLARGADPNAPDANGATPLMWAAYRGSLNLVRELVAAKADPRRKGVIYLNPEKTAYYGNLTGLAAGEGNLPLLRYLLEGLNLPVDDRGYNPETGQDDGWTAAQWVDNRTNLQMEKGGYGQVMAYLERRRAGLAFLLDNNRNAMKDLQKGFAYLQNAAYLASANALEKHLPQYERMLGPQDTLLYANLLDGVAQARYERGEYADALPHWQKAAGIWRQAGGENHPKHAAMLTNLAALDEVRGRYAEAETLYRRVLAIQQAARRENHPEHAKLLGNLAELYKRQGCYVQADSLCQQALAITKQAFGEAHPQYALSLNNLAALYRSLGDYDQARPLYEQALAICRKWPGDEYLPLHADLLNNRAFLYVQLGENGQAQPLYEQALAIRKQVLGEDHPDYAGSLSNLAEVYKNLGRYAEAERLYQQARGIYRQALGEAHPDYATSLNNLAALYQQQERYALAKPLAEQALAIRKAALGEKHPDYALSLNNLAALHRGMGNHAQAAPLYRAAVAIMRDRARQLLPDLNDAGRAAYLASNQRFFDNFGIFTLGRPGPGPATAAELYGLAGDLYDLALATKGARLNLLAQARARVAARRDTALTALQSGWLAARAAQARALELTVQQRLSRSLDPDALGKQAGELEERLFRRLGLQAPAATWQQVRDHLRPGQAAVEILRLKARNLDDPTKTDTVYAALVLAPGLPAPRLAVLTRQGADLEKRHLPAYLDAVRGGGLARGPSVDPALPVKGPSVPPDSLYGLFWRPVLDAVRAADPSLGPALDGRGPRPTLFLAPDGAYHLLNPEALWDPAAKAYAADRADVHRLASTRGLLPAPAPEGTAPQAGPPLLLGRPAYGPGWRDLPGTGDEVDTVVALMRAKPGFRGAVALAGARAGERAVRAAASPRVLHLATHGYYDTGRVARPDPLLRSGLVLAAGDSLSDGLLTAREAQDLDLAATELVVLSACATGTGELRQGEGVFGLQRAFLAAGAGAVLTSLWPVNDQGTSVLMRAFYQEWLGGKHPSVRAAFRAAQERLRRDPNYRDPFHWAAFVLVGD
jgi:tetratricopeptide (TPR) repeat protein